MINTRSGAIKYALILAATSIKVSPDFSCKGQQECLGQCYKYLCLAISSSSMSEVLHTCHEVLVTTVIWLRSESLDSVASHILSFYQAVKAANTGALLLYSDEHNRLMSKLSHQLQNLLFRFRSNFWTFSAESKMNLTCSIPNNLTEIVEDLELSGKLLTTVVATCAKDGYSQD